MGKYLEYFIFRPARRVSTMEATSKLMRSFGVIQQASVPASTSQAILPSGTVLLSHWSRSLQTLCSDWLSSISILFFRPSFPPGLLGGYPHPGLHTGLHTGLHPLLRQPSIPGLSPPATPGVQQSPEAPAQHQSGYPQPPTPDSSNSRESDVFQFPGR